MTTVDAAHRPASSDDAAASQREITAEIGELAESYRRVGTVQDATKLDYAPYRSSLLRHPTKDLRHADPEQLELAAPVFGPQDVDPIEADLTVQHRGEPIGERIAVAGRVLDGDGKPVAHQLVEIWQANAAGRYIHQRDQHHAPIDPNFTGVGRCLTGEDGSYRFLTIKPGPYPWRNHLNAWRPAHIHFSLFGTDFTQRLVTQMYFPGDPLFEFDPIFQAVLDEQAQRRLIATYDHELTRPEIHTGYRWDIVLTGTARTWTERGGRLVTGRRLRAETPGQTVGPFFGYALPFPGGESLVPLGHPGAIRLTGLVLDGAGQPVPDALLEIWQADAGGAIAQVGGSLHRDGYTFTGWGRAATDNVGRYSFTTVLPGPTSTDGVPMIAMTVFARGLLDRLSTRVYLDDGRYSDKLRAEPFLASLPEAERAALIASPARVAIPFRHQIPGPRCDSVPALRRQRRTSEPRRDRLRPRPPRTAA